jgi:protoporphyrinogen oxidase
LAWLPIGATKPAGGGTVSTNRRDFIKFVVAGTVTAGCAADRALVADPTSETSTNTAGVFGEEMQICHQVRDGKFFLRPPASSKHDVIIVGGGVSGLTAAYRLTHRDVLLLEKEIHWGGNAYAMDYQGSTYATGSAFLGSVDSEAFALAKDIGLDPLPVNCPDGSILNGEFVPDTWGSGLNNLPYPQITRESFKRFKDEIMGIDLEKRWKELHGVPFSSFMKLCAREIKQWWDAFGLSNWGTATDDTAATLGIHALQDAVKTGQADVRHTWPGGLGAITRRLSEILKPKYGERMQTGATTVAVIPGKNDVQVTYMARGELRTATAKAVIMATPKLITRRIVEGLPEEQRAAMQKVRYVPYSVVNLIFDKPVFNEGYDTWCPGNSFTDFVVADWVIRKKSGYKQKFNILTCYTPMKEEDRAFLLNEAGARRVAANVLRDFQKLMPSFNVNPTEVHIYRRGHPMNTTTPGLFPLMQSLLRQPMDRIFFANTDSQSPVSSTNEAIIAAGRTVEQAEARLAGAAAAKQPA